MSVVCFLKAVIYLACSHWCILALSPLCDKQVIDCEQYKNFKENPSLFRAYSKRVVIAC